MRIPNTHLIENFRFTLPMKVRYRDLDAMSHMNNAVYFTFFEQARTDYWMALRDGKGPEALDFIVVSAACEYKRPLHYGDDALIGCRISRLGRKSFTMDYEMWTGDRRTLVAVARTVQSFYDYTLKKTILIPSAVRMKVLAFEGGANVLQEMGKHGT